MLSIPGELIEPDDEKAEEKMAEKGGRLVYFYSIDDTAFYSFIYYDEKTPDFSFTNMEFLPFSFCSLSVD